MHHPHEPIMHSRNKISRTNEIPYQCFFKAGNDKSTKIRNTPNSSIHIVMQIMPEIYQTDNLSHKYLTSSMVPLLTGVPRKNLRHLESVPTKNRSNVHMNIR